MNYFTADWHFNHTNILEYCERPFDSVKDMNQHIIDAINATVGKNDDLWFLGDIGFRALDLVLEIKCRRKHIILGNHDKNYTINKLQQYFRIVDKQFELKLKEGNSVFLSHYPHISWNKSFHGAWHLYGHCHGMTEDFIYKVMPRMPMMDVGIDNRFKLDGTYKPFSELELTHMILEKVK